MAWFPDILSRFLTRPVVLQADHGDHDLADHEEIVAVSPPRPRLRFDNFGWLTSPDQSIVIHNFTSERTTALVPFQFVPAQEGPDMLVTHWTATGDKTIDGCARRIMLAPKKGERAASFHAGIGRDGHIAQCVPATKGSWHAGGETAARFNRAQAKVRSSWAPDRGGSVGANRISYGLEMECVGEVRNIEGKWRGWPFFEDVIDVDTGKAIGKRPAGPVVPAADVIEHQNGPRNTVKYYQCMTKAQEETYLAFLVAFREAFPWNTVESMSWTHQRIDPTRKTDPGPIFTTITMPRLMAQAFGGGS